jgi:PAS domain S-box-containing protein
MLTIDLRIRKKITTVFLHRAALKQVGVRLRELSELSSFAACVISRSCQPFIAWLGDGRLLAVNPGFEELAGYKGDELDKLRWPDDFAVPETCDRIKGAMMGLAAADEMPVRHGVLVRKDGSHTEVTASVYQFDPGDGAGLYYFSFIKDLAGRRREQMALREAEAQAELLLDLMSNDIDNMHRVSIRYLELALGTARLQPGERELIMTALGSLMNASRMIGNVRRVNLRERPDFL